MRRNLHDKSVLVTGASRGIGAALARQFAAKGARLALVARDETALETLSSELGGVAEVVCADLSVEADRIRAMDEARAKLGPIDVLVNNAGRGLYGSVETLEPEQLRSTFELNVVAPTHLCALLLPSMRERKTGTIVMVSSVLGARAVPMSGGYCASKFALEALCQSLRAELVDSGVHVLVVRPGRTESSFREAAQSTGFRPNDTMQPMSAAKVAEASVRAVERGATRVNFTSAGRAMMAAERVSPAIVDRVMSKLYRKMVKGTDAEQ